MSDLSDHRENRNAYFKGQFAGKRAESDTPGPLPAGFNATMTMYWLSGFRAGRDLLKANYAA